MTKVNLETNYGTIGLQLDEAKAPDTVRNFVEYVKSGHYDGTIFHR
ncbi:MAG: peptidyl-prolyl cis-trans isomerase, partial [Nocardia sp.]|nr:peptidyl-prolyl cis-trans isomerase [Nocardia sp.]